MTYILEFRKTLITKTGKSEHNGTKTYIFDYIKN